MHNPIQREVFKANYRHMIPAGAKAVIIAEFHEDQSDLQSDYFAHRTTKRIILGFSTHTRDLFSEMRKAAALAPETAHLAGEIWDARIVLAADKTTGCSPYYHEGQRSPWHREEEPDEPFKSEAEARAWTEGVNIEPLSLNDGDGGMEMPFRWEITKRNAEHREKYSMGGGYYLMDGYRHSTGWCVKKIRFYGADPIDSIPTAGRWIGAALGGKTKAAA